MRVSSRFYLNIRKLISIKSLLTINTFNFMYINYSFPLLYINIIQYF
nr:MAG TPA: hypothetical protein [Caudoviricetes sp.]